MFWGIEIMGAILYVAQLVATGAVARSKGRQRRPWMLLALVFPIIALIIVAVSPSRREPVAR